MNIHVVQPGDTIYTIAGKYGVSPKRLSLENDIRAPYNLAIGEALVIFKPSRTYIVQRGDTLENIAEEQGTDVMELLRNNPNVSNRELYEGEELVISYADSRTASVRTNGFAYPFIERETLRKALPYLTYLTVYSYQVMPNGNLIDIDDTEIVRMAKEFGVAPIMLINAPHEGEDVDTEIAHNLISDTQIRNTFINSILSILRNKGYDGINIDTPYIQPLDREPYVEFISNITALLNREGFSVTVTIDPSTFEVSTGIIYNGVDYVGLSQAANSVLYQLTYAWRYHQSLPISILPFDAVIRTMDKAMALIPPEKFILGVSIVGYLWEFPYFEAITNANFLSYGSAIELANDTEAVIEFNEPSRSSYFQFLDDGREYMAWFKDSRVIYPLLAYALNSGVRSVSVWNIMYFITNIWLLINVQYKIERMG